MTQYLVTITPIVPTVQTPFFSPLPQVYAAPQSVQLLCGTPGAQIYYTLDGSVPTTSSALYSGPISVSDTEMIRAIATAPGYANSAVLSGNFTITPLQAATPTFSLSAGTYVGAQTVSISCVTSGAQIRYTTDGTTPSGASTLYAGPLNIAINSTETINAIAFATNINPSQVASATYTTTYPVAATPTFSPAAGTYTGSQSVRIACATSGAAIHYTLDGSTPTSASPVYSSQITVSASETISAIAIATDFQNSAVGVAAYTINLPMTQTPTFSPAAGTYTGTQSVSIACSTSGATIYYTLDGSTPTTASSVYSGPLSLAVSTTINAIATASGYTQSAQATAAYTINLATAAQVSFSLPTGTYTGTQSISLSCSTAASSIYYTTDGSQPTTSSNLYSGPIKVTATETITAFSTATGYNPSAAVANTYTINAATQPQCAAPMFTPLSGTYANSALVSMACVTAGATIYYTIDGTTPTTSSIKYTNPITITSSETFNAIATASGYTTSQVSTSQYTITSGSTQPLAVNLSYMNVTGNLATFPLNIFKTTGSGGSGSVNGLCNISTWQPMIGSASIYDYFVQHDSSGYPTSMTTTDGRTITAFTLGVFGDLNLPPGATVYYPAGTYRFECTGPIDMTISGDCPTTTLNTTNAGVNSVTFTVTPTGLGLHFSYTIPGGGASGYPKLMSCVQNMYASAYDGGEEWHPLMKAMCANYACIRDMHYQQMDGGYVTDLFLTTAPNTSMGAGSTATMKNPWVYKSGTYNTMMGNGQYIPLTFTAGSTTVTFTQAITGKLQNSGVTLANGSTTTLPVNGLTSGTYNSGYEVLITSGPNAGLLAPIASNTANSIVLSSSFPNAFGLGVVHSGAATATSTGPNKTNQLTGSGFPTVTSANGTVGSWTPSPTATYYLLFTSGANAGSFQEISGNTGTTISLSKSFANTITAGDQYEVCTGTTFQILATTHDYMRYRAKGPPASYGLVAAWNWASRPLITDFSWGQYRGGPVEAVAMLANELGCDLWHNMPAHMTSSECQLLAQLMKSGTNAVVRPSSTFNGLSGRWYAEPMNEIWLSSDPNSAWCHAAGLQLYAPYIGPYSASYNWTPEFNYAGEFACRRAVDIQSVYGSSFSSKVTVMAPGQQGNAQPTTNAINPNFSSQGNPFLFNGGFNGVAPGSLVTAYGVTAANVGFYWPGSPGCFDFAGDGNGYFANYVVANLTAGSDTFSYPGITEKINGVNTQILHPALMQGALITGNGIATNITQPGSGTTAVTVESVSGPTGGPWTVTMSAAATSNETAANLVVDPNYILLTQSDGGVSLLTTLATSNPNVNGLPLYANGSTLPSTGYIGLVANFNSKLLPILAEYGNLEMLGYEGGNNFSPFNLLNVPGYGLYYPSGTNDVGVICPYFTQLENLYQTVFRGPNAVTIYNAQLTQYAAQFSLQAQFDICGPYGPYFFHILESAMQLGDGQGHYNALSACPYAFQAMQNFMGKTYAPSG